MMFFYFFLSVIFLLDALSLNRIKSFEYMLVLQTPIILFLIDLFQRKSLKIPKKPFILEILFLVSFVVANIFSGVQSNFLHELGLYAALILTSLYVYNHQEQLLPTLQKAIIVISLILVVINFFKPQLVKIIPFFSVDNSHIISYTRISHNHLGDFLVLPLVLLIIKMMEEKITFIRATSFLVIFLSYVLSYSRSAYLSLILILAPLIYPLVKVLNAKKKIVIVVILLTSIFFLFASPTLTHYIYKGPGIKNMFGTRELYYRVAIEGFLKKPFFGWGTNNYYRIPLPDNVDQKAGSIYSHNIFLDILSENGIFTFIVFFIMIGYPLLFGKKNIYYFLYGALLVNFQTDYTYTIVPFIWLFFVILGLIIE